MRDHEFERLLIQARDDFDRKIAALETELSRLPSPPDSCDERWAVLDRLHAARERCERRILAAYPER